MKIRDFIKDIENDPKLAPYINLIPKKNKKTQMDAMHVLNRLSYILYLSDNLALSQYIIDKMIQVDFDGDYRYWEPVQNVGLLAIYIDKTKYIDRVKDMIEDARNYGDEDNVFVKQKIHKRFLTGVRLNALKAETEASQNEVVKMNKRLVVLFHLFYLNAFSDELDMNPQLVYEEINSMLLILRQYIQINGFDNLYPFK